MECPEYLSLKGAHEALTAMGSATTCCIKQTVDDESVLGMFESIRQFLGEAYADQRVLATCHLQDAFHLMELAPTEHRPGCARLARILGEAGRRPLTDHDLGFARRALDYWSALRANLA